MAEPIMVAPPQSEFQSLYAMTTSSTADRGRHVASIASAFPSPGEGPRRASQPVQRLAPTPDVSTGSDKRSSAGSSCKKGPSPLPTANSQSGLTDSCHSTCAAYAFPHWRQDAMVYDLEGGCDAWAYGRDRRTFTWLPSTLFGSSLDRKIRNPAACDAINYECRSSGLLPSFIVRFILLFIYCYLLSLCHRKLEMYGIQCNTSTIDGTQSDRPGNSQGESLAFIWAHTLVTTGACFLLAQGYYGVRAARERMERVKQTTVTLAYSFLKTMLIEPGVGLNKDDLQTMIYECLALLTAYPVALLEQVRGNTCEPALTKYCEQVARALKKLKDGDDSVIGGHFYRTDQVMGTTGSHRALVTVEYFFEIFSLHLSQEFSQQQMRTKVPALTTQRILYSLRDHFENFVDVGNLDDRRTPIIRENIDMLALAGRELSVFAFEDVIPIAFLWSVTVASWLIALYCPIQRCETIVDWSVPRSPGGHATDFQVPSLGVLLPMALLALLSAVLLTVLDEMWRMWDPFRSGMNTFAFTLSIATEIDNMMNEFYEYDLRRFVRKHSYMDSSSWLNTSPTADGDGSSGNRAQTV